MTVCTKQAIKGGVCITPHGTTKMKRCSQEQEGCAKQAQRKGRVCIMHGKKVNHCRHNGCTNGAVKGEVCKRHGVKVKPCSREGCAKQAK